MARHRTHPVGTRPTVLAAVLALVAGLTVTWSVAGPVEQAAAVGLGTVEARVFDHLGTTGTQAGNCIKYSPTVGAPSSTSSAWVGAGTTAWTAHGFSGSCPTAMNFSQQSAVGVTPSGTTDATDGVLFPLAKVEHSNRPISSTAAARYTGKLAVRLSAFNAPNDITFDWSMWETPNSTSCDPGVPNGGGTNCLDEIKFTNQISSNTLTQNGVTFRVVIAGFDKIPANVTSCPTTPSQSLTDTFWTDEGGSTFSCIYASLVQVRNVTLVKQTTGTGSVPTRNFQFSSSGTLAGSQWTAGTATVASVAPNTPKTVHTREILRGDTATVTEVDPADDRWSVTGIACTEIAADGVTVVPLPQAAYNTAARQLVLTNVPASPNPLFPNITCTYTNTYTPKATVTLVKQLTGTPTGPAVPGNWTLGAVGPITVSGQSGTTAVTAVRVPAGNYQLSETGTGNAASGYAQVGAWSCTTGGAVAGGAVTLADRAASEAAVVCTVTNRWTTGSLRVSKAPIQGPAGAFTGTAATPFTFSYDCGTGYTGTQTVSTGTARVITDIPVGRTCSVSETAPTGNLLNTSYAWENPSYSAQPVTITDGATAEVTVTNSIRQNTGTLTITKAVPVGPGGYTGGSTRPFPVTYSCAIGATTVAQGTVDVSTGTAASVPNIPSTAVCSFTENLAAQAGDFADGSYRWSTHAFSPVTVTIGVGGTASTTVTNNHVRDYGSLTVTKAPVGAGYLGGTTENFTVDYTCGPLTGSVTLASGGSKTVTDIPAGTSCLLTERSPAADLLSPSHVWGAPSWSAPSTVIVAGTTVTRTVTNPTVAVFGKVAVTKQLAGATNGVTAGTAFVIAVDCGPGFTSPAGTTVTAGGTWTTPDLPVGTTCTVTETAPAGGLVDASYSWGTTPAAQTVTVTRDATAPVTLTNTVNRVHGGLQVTKTLVDPDDQVAAGRTFSLGYSCQYGNNTPVTGTFALAAGTTGTAPSGTLLLGSVCTVTEDPATLNAPPNAADPSYIWSGTPAPVTVTLSAAAPNPSVGLTNTVSRITGSFAVTKSVTGNGASDGYTGDFGFTWSCTAPGYSDGGSFTLAAGGTFSSPAAVPAAASCTVTENQIPAAAAGFAWGTTTSAVGGAAATDGTTATFTLPVTGGTTVAFVNPITRVTGAVSVAKVVGGETAGLVPGTDFPITLDCGPGGVFTLNPTADTPDTVDGIAIGSVCTVTESLPADGLLDASYAWGEVTYDPQTVTVEGAQVSSTVTNTITRVTRPVSLTKVRTDTHDVARTRTFTGSWSCTYDGGVVASGTWSLAAGQTVEPAPAVPLTANCTATENAPTAPSLDTSYRWSTPVITPITVGGGTDTVVVTNNVYRVLGSVTLTKELSGATDGYTGGTDELFTVTISCPLAGVGTINRQVVLAAGATTTIPDIPVGLTCTVGEQSPSAPLADGSYRWGTPAFAPTTVTLTDAAPDPSAVVTNPIERVHGSLQIVKTVSDEFGAVTDDAVFTGGWSCTYPGDPAVTGVWTVGATGGLVAAALDGEPAEILLGSVCSVTEDAPTGGLANGSYAWTTPTLGDPVTIAGVGEHTLTVDNAVERHWGALSVSKVIAGETAGVPATATYDGTWTCTLGTEVYTGRFTVGAGQTATVFTAADRFAPATAVCSIVEDTPDGTTGPAALIDGSYSYTGWTAGDPVELTTADTRDITLTNTVGRVYGAVGVRKEVTGAAAALVDPVRPYTGTLSCVYGADTPVEQTWDATTGTPDSIDGILVGSVCTVTEDAQLSGPVAADPSYVWDPWTVSGTVVVPAPTADPAAVTVTNPTSRTLGTFLVGKVVTGATEGIVPDAPLYPVTYTCLPGTGDQITGTMDLLPGSTSRSVDVPVGSTCTLTEPADTLPELRDAAWTWDQPTFAVVHTTGTAVERGITFQVPVPGEDAADEAAVTVTNNVTRTQGSWSLAKTATPGTGVPVQPGSSVQYTLTVTVADGVPVHDIVVTDDLTAVDVHATLPGTFTPSAGAATLGPDGVLTWTLPETTPTGTHTLTYAVTVDSDAFGEVLVNAATGTGDTPPGSCSPEPCSTTHPVLQPATVSKAVVGTPTQNPTSGVWTVRYRITVDNPNTVGAVPYTLSDTFGFAPGVSVGAVSITAPAGVTTAPGFNGRTQPVLVTAGSVPPSDHVFDITVLATVPASVPDAVRPCDPAGAGHGWFNTVSLTSFAVPDSGTACAPIRDAIVPTVTKTAGLPVQQADGSWTVSYTVTVTNPSSQFVGEYDLSDTFRLGNGITVTGGPAVTGPAGVTLAAGWNGADRSLVASAVRLPARVGALGVHTYQVSATVTVATTATSADRDCELTGQESGTGFLNTVALTVGDRTPVTAQACATPVSPTVDKEWSAVEQNLVDGQWDGTWTVRYTVTVTNPSTTTALRYVLTDTPDFPSGVEILDTDVAMTRTGEDVPLSLEVIDGAVVVAQQHLPAGATDVYTLAFRVEVPPTVTSQDCFGNLADVTSGGDTFSDSACAPVQEQIVPTVGKSVIGRTQNADGSWTVDYRITVTNPAAAGGPAARYDLADSPQFGAGIAITSASITQAPAGVDASGWGTPAFGAIVSGRSLAAGVTETYDVRLTATVSAQATPADRDCTVGEGESGTGFLNTATLTAAGQTRDTESCTTPISPVVDKSFVGTRQEIVDGTWTGSWLSDWTVKVTNPAPAGPGAPDVVYSLTDTPAFPAGVTVEGVSLLSATDLAGDALSPTPSVDFAAGTATLSPARVLTAGGTDTYTLQVRFSIADDKVITETCDAADALVNRAIAASGSDEPADAACAEVPQAPTPQVTKTVHSSTQQADGRWVVEYDLAVQNPAAAGGLATRYDLSDTPRFGGGIDIVEAAVAQAPAGVDVTGWSAPGFGEIATGRSLAAGLTETYRVRVVAEVTAASTPTSRDCELTEGEDGTGFLNVATVTGPGGGMQAPACTSPVLPEITKDAVSLEPGEVLGTYRATYRVTVTNPDAATALYYAASDEPVLPAGVTLSDPTVTAVATDLAGTPIDGIVPVDAAWTGQAPTTSLTVGSQQLPAATRHVYTVSFLATVADDATDLSCATDGGGLGNRAEVTSGGVAAEDGACLEVPVRVVVDKTWSINGVEYAQGEQPPGFGAVASLDDADVAWGEVVDGFEAGSTVLVGETVTLPSQRCTSTAAGLGAVDLDRALVRVAVVNTVVCEGSLTLVKQVLSVFGGQADADEFTVVATPAAGGDPISGAGAATGSVEPGSTWTLSESGGPTGWVQAGAWVCTDAGGSGAVFGADSVTVGYGSDITCVVTNTDVEVEVLPTGSPSPSPSTPAPTSGPTTTATTVVTTTTTTSVSGTDRPLAHTGFNAGASLTWAFLLLLGGLGLVVAMRRRTGQH